MPSWQTERFTSRFRAVGKIRADRAGYRRLGRDLKHFFQDTWLDWLVLVILGCTTAGVWVAPHTFNRLFPITFFDNSGDIVWTQFAYPYVAPPLNSTLVAVVCAVVPIIVILVSQLWVQSFLDAANGILGLVWALITGTLFQVVLKKTIGGLRPHFLAVCDPVFPTDPATLGRGYKNIMFTIDEVCTGNEAKVKNATESFPSGHSQIAFAGLGYLAIYLFAHLGIQNQRRPSLWRMTCVVAPVLLATYEASTLVLSYNHHGYDVLAGGIIGTFAALFAYRQVFMSVWNRRWNAVPRCRYENEDKWTDFNAEPGPSRRETLGHNNTSVLPK